MTLRTPLVEADGEPQALQPGDTLDSNADGFQRTFTSTTVPGQAVFADGVASVGLAIATSDATSKPS